MARARVLLIEDDPQLADVIRAELLRFVDLDVAPTGREGLARAAATRYAVVLLDLNLPDVDGLSVAEQLRDTGPEILMLTARADVRSRVAGLYAGAADYLAKPFHMEELVARLHARLRAHQPHDRVRVGALDLDLAGRQLRVEHAPIALTPQEYDLLVLLATHPGRVFSKEEITDQLYADAPPASNAVEALVSRLRAKLQGTAAADAVVTVRGFGYVVR